MVNLGQLTKCLPIDEGSLSLSEGLYLHIHANSLFILAYTSFILVNTCIYFVNTSLILGPLGSGCAREGYKGGHGMRAADGNHLKRISQQIQGVRIYFHKN